MSLDEGLNKSHTSWYRADTIFGPANEIKQIFYYSINYANQFEASKMNISKLNVQTNWNSKSQKLSTYDSYHVVQAC